MVIIFKKIYLKDLEQWNQSSTKSSQKKLKKTFKLFLTKNIQFNHSKKISKGIKNCKATTSMKELITKKSLIPLEQLVCRLQISLWQLT